MNGLPLALVSTAAASLLVCSAGCGRKETSSAASPSSLPAAQRPIVNTGMVSDNLDPNAVVVTVGDAKLTQGELRKRIDRLLRAQGLDGMPADQLAMMRQQAQNNIVQAFVAETVLTKEADRLEIKLAPEAVAEQMERIKQELPAGTDLKTALESIGTTEDELRDSLVRDLRIRKLIEQQGGAQEVTDKEAEDFYAGAREQFVAPETVRAKHILVACDTNATVEVRAQKQKLAEDTRQKLVDGGDFAKLAADVSDCPSKARGGDLGQFPRGAMVPEFEVAAFAQATNDIGAVVTTPFGFHIIQVSEHAAGGTQEFANVKADIKTHLARNRQQETAMKYIEGLVQKAGVKYE